VRLKTVGGFLALTEQKWWAESVCGPGNRLKVGCDGERKGCVWMMRGHSRSITFVPAMKVGSFTMVRCYCCVCLIWVIMCSVGIIWKDGRRLCVILVEVLSISMIWVERWIWVWSERKEGGRVWSWWKGGVWDWDRREVTMSF